jgi:hypothetical protein
MERIGEAIQVGQEIAVVEIGSAMEKDDGRALPDLSAIQVRALDRMGFHVAYLSGCSPRLLSNPKTAMRNMATQAMRAPALLSWR